MILLLRLYYNFLKTVLQDTMSIKNRLQLNSLQQSVAPNKVAPISQPSSCNSTNVNHLCQYNAVSMIFPNVTWAFTTCRETLTELLKSVQVSIVTYLEVLFWTAYSLVSLFQTAVNQYQSSVQLFMSPAYFPRRAITPVALYWSMIFSTLRGKSSQSYSRNIGSFSSQVWIVSPSRSEDLYIYIWRRKPSHQSNKWCTIQSKLRSAPLGHPISI